MSKMNPADLDDIISRFEGTYLHDSDAIEYHVLQIVETIKEASELGYNSILYEIKHNELNRIVGEIKYLWPDISIKTTDKGLFIDWS